MDWAKAKTILIVSLLVTNIILFSVFLKGRGAKDPSLSKNFIASTTARLEEKDIMLAIDIPKYIPKLNSLLVEYERVTASILNNSFFEDKGKVTSVVGNCFEIEAASGNIKAINNRKFSFQRKDVGIKEFTGSVEDAQTIALDYLNSLDFKTDDMKLSFSEEENGVFTLVYSKLYNDNLIELSNTTFVIDDKGVVSLEREWLNVIDENTTPLYIKTAPISLLSLINNEDCYNKTISNIELCHFFKPFDYSDFKVSEDTLRGKTTAAWRIQFSDGYVKIIGNN